MAEDSQITRQELTAFTEAHAKSAVALEKMTQKLEIITVSLENLSDQHSQLLGKISENIVSGVNGNYAIIHRETMSTLDRMEKSQAAILNTISNNIPDAVSEKIKNSSLSTDMAHIKWIVGIVSFVTIVVTVMIRLMGTGGTAQDKLLQHLLEKHIEQTGVVHGTSGQSL